MDRRPGEADFGAWVGPTLKVRSLTAPLCGCCTEAQLRYPDPELLSLLVIKNRVFSYSRIRKTLIYRRFGGENSINFFGTEVQNSG